MRIVERYIDGKPIWSENIPSRARIPGHRGSMIAGGDGPTENERKRKALLTRNQSKPDARPVEPGRPRQSPDIERVGRGRAYASDEERTAARRAGWRESSRRSRQRSSAA